MKATINDFATGVMRSAVGVEVEVVTYESGGKTALIKMPPPTKEFKFPHAGKECRILTKWIDAEEPTEKETTVPKKTEAVKEEAVQEEQEIQVGMSLDENGEVVVEMTKPTSDLDIVDEETGEEVVEGEPVEMNPEEKVGEATDDIPVEAAEEATSTLGGVNADYVIVDDVPQTPVQTEMFVKSELDDATAVLAHLTAERKKRLKAVDTAESNLDEIETRVSEQKRVIARIQSQLPAAAPTPEAAPEAEVIDEEVPEEDIEIEMDESDADWTEDEEDEDGESE